MWDEFCYTSDMLVHVLSLVVTLGNNMVMQRWSLVLPSDTGMRPTAGCVIWYYFLFPLLLPPQSERGKKTRNKCKERISLLQIKLPTISSSRFVVLYLFIIPFLCVCVSLIATTMCSNTKDRRRSNTLPRITQVCWLHHFEVVQQLHSLTGLV